MYIYLHIYRTYTCIYVHTYTYVCILPPPFLFGCPKARFPKNLRSWLHGTGSATHFPAAETAGGRGGFRPCFGWVGFLAAGGLKFETHPYVCIYTFIHTNFCILDYTYYDPTDLFSLYEKIRVFQTKNPANTTQFGWTAPNFNFRNYLLKQ